MPTKKEESNLAAQDMLRRFKANIFQALAHPTRVHILELLKSKEYTVSELLDHLKVEQSNASQHLAVLKSKNLVSARKAGNQTYYSLRDPLLGEVLDSLKGFFQAHIDESMQVLRNL